VTGSAWTATMGETRLSINRSASRISPSPCSAAARTITRGITVEASHVLIDGVRAQDPEAPGIELSGTSLTVQNSAVISPRGGDGDGIRFWVRTSRFCGTSSRTPEPGGEPRRRHPDLRHRSRAPGQPGRGDRGQQIRNGSTTSASSPRAPTARPEMAAAKRQMCRSVRILLPSNHPRPGWPVLGIVA